MDVNERVRAVVEEYGRLSDTTLTDEADLYIAGMTSHSSVNVMLALETAFDIEFPDEMLTRETFQSIQAISDAVRGLIPQQV